MSKKIVVMPGVGIHKNRPVYEAYLDKVLKGIRTRGVDCVGEVHIWENGHADPPDPILPYKDIRRFFCGILLDFMFAIKDGGSIPVPEADYYIGHSAGSLIALMQERPSIIFGSPAILVDLIYDDILKAKWARIVRTPSRPPVCNIINKYDQIAYPIGMPYCEDYVFASPWWKFLSKEPLTCHTSYWSTQEVVDVTVDRISKWAKM